jgi:hypothetical protein
MEGKTLPISYRVQNITARVIVEQNVFCSEHYSIKVLNGKRLIGVSGQTSGEKVLIK